MRLTVFAAATLLLLFPAQAGWQGFDWGDKVTSDMPAEYSSAGSEFAVRYLADESGNLARVELEPVSAMPLCLYLPETLLGIYGESVRTSDQGTEVHLWRDEVNDNLVYLVSGNEGCSVTYEPLLTPNSPGGL